MPKIKSKKSAQLKSTRPKWLRWKVVIPVILAVSLVGGFLTYMSFAATAVTDNTWERPIQSQVSGGVRTEKVDSISYRVATPKKPVSTWVSTEEMGRTGQVCIKLRQMSYARTRYLITLTGQGKTLSETFYATYARPTTTTKCLDSSEYNEGAKLTISVSPYTTPEGLTMNGEEIGIAEIYGKVYDCKKSVEPGRSVPGFKDGQEFIIRICPVRYSTSTGSEDAGQVWVNGKYLNQWSDLLYKALRDGVRIVATSSFRSNDLQQRLYDCYVSPSCDGPEAAVPGTSNHQFGAAVDIDIVEGTGNDPSLTECINNPDAYPVYKWLAANAPAYGINATVNSECWHWEAVN